MTDFNPTITPMVYTKSDVDAIIKNKLQENLISWNASFNIDNIIKQGIYYISGERISFTDNLPILNTGYISGQITVLDANGCITQYLKLTNAGGSEGKEYIRTYTSGSWSTWRELQSTTVFNNGIDDASLKNYEDNGYYTGAILNTIGSATGSDLSNLYQITEAFKVDIKTSKGYAHLPSGTFFTMKVMNNYAVVKASQSWGASAFHTITQKADIQLWDGTFLCVQRSRIADSGWSNWKIINI